MLLLVKKFFKSTKNEKLIFIEAYITSIFVRCMLLFLPFKRIQKKIEKKDKPNNFENVSECNFIELIQISLKRVKKYAFWRFECIEQSLTAAYLLKRRKIPFTLYMGIHKNKDKFYIHVWIVSCNCFIVEKGNVEYQLVNQIDG